MNVLIIASGGREHALAWKLRQGADVDTVYCAPGNPNMTGIEPVAIEEMNALADFAIRHDVRLTVVGPEAPLCDGIVDVFREKSLPIFGPTKEAAQLEGSKTFAKEFMVRHAIPTAAYRKCLSADDARDCVREFGPPVVVKADGLAAGKGVTVAQTIEEADQAVDECLSGRFGEAGQIVVVEECLVGEEASILAFTDGKTIIPLASSQDHKRIGEGDTGPNTGGMGAYSPAPVVTHELWNTIQSDVLERFRKGCNRDGLDYRGVIYAGIMVTPNGPKVLEFNVRFGDPETQAVLMRLESDLAQAMIATVEGRLDSVTLDWSPEPAVCVVMASGGYPGKYEKGHVITGLSEAETKGAVVFHAGTARKNNDVVTAGGRVLGVTAKGRDLQQALNRVYEAVDCIDWKDAYHRRDIAHRALARM
ncbi:MAG: phosphoribosylamine--glycine ligase [Candidatus Pacebacteria bacterium]|nr:phosphoribosylamine--glycine ligase [Candidatus Paceibacterota bacterium]